MANCQESPEKPSIIGRSSSHFTRVTRIFAAELELDCSLEIVPDLMSQDTSAYGGNPALRVPALRTSNGVWFGALNICRELLRQSPRRPAVVWPEALEGAVLANAQELVLQAMSSEVSLIMARMGGGSAGAHQDKLEKSLVNMLVWLESNAADVFAALPPARDLSFLEVTLFCLVQHLEFRSVVPVSGYGELQAFCQRFAVRPSAQGTPFRFDV
jgi:glutathione S-transferase